MNTMIAFVKRLRLARIVVVFLAGILLLVNTACSQPSSAKTSNPKANLDSPSSSVYDKDNVVLEGVKESYKTVPPEGGMNNYPDVDRRMNTSATEARSQELVNRAQGNLQNNVRNPKGTVENLQDNISADKIKNKLGDVSGAVGESSQQIKEGTEKGFENLKTNLKTTAGEAYDKAQQTVR